MLVACSDRVVLISTSEMVYSSHEGRRRGVGEQATGSRLPGKRTLVIITGLSGAGKSNALAGFRGRRLLLHRQLAAAHDPGRHGDHGPGQRRSRWGSRGHGHPGEALLRRGARAQPRGCGAGRGLGAPHPVYRLGRRPRWSGATRRAAGPIRPPATATFSRPYAASGGTSPTSGRWLTSSSTPRDTPRSTPDCGSRGSRNPSPAG